MAKRLRLAVLVLVALAAAPTQGALTLSWGTYPDNEVYDSYGNFVTSTNFTAALGIFHSNFVPTLANMDQWAIYWRELDQGVIAAPLGDFGNDYVVNDYPAPVAGMQTYVWLYNELDYSLASTEWALVTDDSSDGDPLDDWILPDLSGGGDIQLEWRVGEPESAIYGGYMDTPGTGTAVAPATAYVLQTNRLSPVPEPGTLTLLFPAVLMALRRRRKTFNPSLGR